MFKHWTAYLILCTCAKGDVGNFADLHTFTAILINIADASSYPKYTHTQLDTDTKVTCGWNDNLVDSRLPGI